MKPSLQLKVSQQLTMTPQLQQAIKLLQLSSLDLMQEIQEALESNPMLESVDESPAEDNSDYSGQETAASHTNDQDDRTQLADDVPVDSIWDDNYHYAPPSMAGRDHSDDKDFESYNSSALTLHDHLTWQLNLTPFSDTDRVIALMIIESVDNDGYLSSSLEELHSALDDEDIELDEIEAVLHRLQHFDPAGVCARDLKECLEIQLKQLHADTPMQKEALCIISEHMDLLASRDFTQLRRRLKFPEDVFNSAFQLIRSLNPHPGDVISQNDTQYIAPDLKVSKKQGRWVVELNHEVTPKLRINSDYAALVKRADSSTDNQFLRNHLQEARWFLKSLNSRHETLIKVAAEIVERQRGFLEYGEEAMKPMVLHDIAEAVGMHESTISRVTTQKYLHTPRGIFELKYFFSSHVNTADGGECSATAIRALIRKLIANENCQKPLSDNKIATVLKEQGINVARRTIAKYREAMRIPPSNERKALL